MKFSFPIEPQPKQSAKFCETLWGIRSYQPHKVTKFKNIVRTLALSQRPAGFKIFDDAVKVDVTFYFRPVTSMRKKDILQIILGKIFWKKTKPDVDNLTKALFDSLNGVLWVDDALVCDYHVRKIFAHDTGHIEMTIESLVDTV